MDKLRLRFSKTGRAIYLSHLDLMRTMQRVFIRCEVPIKYSEGFNPHAQVSIALPLSLGTASVCELMDFRVSHDIELEGLVEKLNKTMPEGIIVHDVWENERKASEIKWLSIEGRLEYDERNLDKMAKGIEEFFAQDSIVIMKRTKRGEGEFELAPYVKDVKLSIVDGYVKLEAKVSAQEPTVNPEHLASALRQLREDLAPDFASFTRLETYDKNMKVFR